MHNIGCSCFKCRAQDRARQWVKRSSRKADRRQIRLETIASKEGETIARRVK